MKPNVIQPGYDEAPCSTGSTSGSSSRRAGRAARSRHGDAARGYRHRLRRARPAHRDHATATATVTAYAYDPLTFRLARLAHHAPGLVPGERAQTVQDLTYYYDPAGNITHIQDDADTQNVVFFRNQRVEPSTDYALRRVYRLTTATGREHLGQTGRAARTAAAGHRRRRLPHRSAAARRRQRDGHLHGEVSVRPGRQPPVRWRTRSASAAGRAATRTASRRRSTPARDEQPADVDEPARRPGRGPVLRHVRATTRTAT